MNATPDMSAMATVSPGFSWLVTIIVFIVVLLMIFLLSKNFRQFIYGAIISTILILNYKLSRWIGVSTIKNNFVPLKWTGYIIGFIIASIIIGRLAQKLKFVKNLEKELEK